MITSLVTGNRGFIGRHLSKYLKSKGETVVGFDMLDNYPTIEVLADFLKTNNVDRVYHLGARAFIPDCYGNTILSVLNSNTVFTANLLVASKRVGIKKLLYFSTSEVYGTPRYIPIDEEHPVSPQSTYAATKLAAENMCRTFSAETGLDTIIMRQFNVYGPWDTQPRIIPKLIRSAIKNEVIDLGNIDVRRDFTYVDDACKAAYSLMGAWTLKGSVYNNGSGISYSIHDIINLIMDITNKQVVFTVNNNLKRPWDVDRLECKHDKIESLCPELSERICIEDGLEKTIAWYRERGSWPWE